MATKSSSGKSGVVRHALIQWMEGDPPVQQYAYRGDEVTLPAEEFDRLDAHGAFRGADTPMEPDLFPVGGDQMQQVAWLSTHSVDQAVDSARADRSSVPLMLAAEKSRPESAQRRDLVQVLSQAQ